MLRNNFVAKYLEIEVKSPKKSKELLEKAPHHLCDEAKLLLGIAEEEKEMK
ncbi:MAG: hypothetical protein V3U20_05225 [Thermoplasmata archaeon]